MQFRYNWTECDLSSALQDAICALTHESARPGLAFSYLFGAQVQHASVISRTDRASYREAGGIGPLRQLTPIDTRVGGLQRLVTSAPPPYSRPIVVPSQFLSMQRTGGRYNLNVEENLHVLRIFQTGRAVCSAHCAQIFAAASQWNKRDTTQRETQSFALSETQTGQTDTATYNCNTGAKPINCSLPAKRLFTRLLYVIACYHTRTHRQSHTFFITHGFTIQSSANAILHS